MIAEVCITDRMARHSPRSSELKRVEVEGTEKNEILSSQSLELTGAHRRSQTPRDVVKSSRWSNDQLFQDCFSV